MYKRFHHYKDKCLQKNNIYSNANGTWKPLISELIKAVDGWNVSLFGFAVTSALNYNQNSFAIKT